MTNYDWDKPAWWELSKPGPRRSLPAELDPTAWRSDKRALVEGVEREAVAWFETQDAEGHFNTNGNLLVCANSSAGAWACISGTFGTASVIVATSPGEPPHLTRRNRVTLEEIGFSDVFLSDGSVELAAYLTVDKVEPAEAWALAGRIAAVAVLDVYAYLDPALISAGGVHSFRLIPDR